MVTLNTEEKLFLVNTYHVLSIAFHWLSVSFYFCRISASLVILVDNESTYNSDEFAKTEADIYKSWLEIASDKDLGIITKESVVWGDHLEPIALAQIIK